MVKKISRRLAQCGRLNTPLDGSRHGESEKPAATGLDRFTWREGDIVITSRPSENREKPT